ncbi:MAG: NAD(P)/FAD-dependent oxidoreductase [Cytophagaceae bacterium]
MTRPKIAIIGGGAAGFFGAITCSHYNPDVEISLLEKNNKLLSKVKISGGGRCNVTHACYDPKLLLSFYPRGAKCLKTVFKHFSVTQTIDWFKKRKVLLKTESDNRMFPESNDSQTIVDCLFSEALVNGIKVLTDFGVGGIEVGHNSFVIKLRGGESLHVDRILIATGGNPNTNSYQWLQNLGHTIIPPVPSLFTFNVPNSRLNGLQGISVEHARIKIQNNDFIQEGPLLITHWGFSGPAILKLSAWAARYLNQQNYEFNIMVNWIPEYNEERLRDCFFAYRKEFPKRNVINHPVVNIPRRLWERMAILNEIDSELTWGELPNRNINKLIEELLRGVFCVKGKTTFKEEFVTCGGIDLADVNPETMESKKVPGLYFAGEVLDIDGVTGGFNFQAAWSTGFLAGKSMAESIKKAPR